MIQNNSQNIKPGDTFVVIPNPKEAEYVKEALEKGAAIIVGQTHIGPYVPDPEMFIKTDNPRLYLANELAKERNFAQPNYCVAVTGTNGKTSIVTFLEQIWRHLGHLSGSLGTMGLMVNGREAKSALTTPDPVLFSHIVKELPVDYFAFEASSHGLLQHRTDGVKLSAVGFTNLTQDHLDYHLTMEDYFKAKSRLFTELATDQTRKVIYKGCAYGRRLIEMNLPNTITYNSDPIFSTKEELQVFGRVQTQNLNAAILLSGFSLDEINPILPLLTPPKGRFEYVGMTKNMAKVFVDYAHTPHALQNVLMMAREVTRTKVIVVFGCGGERDKTKRPIMGRIASEYADLIIVTDDNPRYENSDVIRQEVLKGTEHAFEIQQRENAIFQAIKMAQEGDVIVIAGKGHEEYQEIQGYKYEFSDVQVAKDAIG